jgi:hypothetical protein
MILDNDARCPSCERMLARVGELCPGCDSDHLHASPNRTAPPMHELPSLSGSDPVQGDEA